MLKRKIAQLEVDAVRSRMNPHFLFNALSSIQNLINEKQIEQANQFLSQFGDLVPVGCPAPVHDDGRTFPLHLAGMKIGFIGVAPREL